MYTILAAECWLQAGLAMSLDKDLAMLFGQKALIYDRLDQLGRINDKFVAELDQLQTQINARLKFREECN